MSSLQLLSDIFVRRKRFQICRFSSVSGCLKQHRSVIKNIPVNPQD
ncbi:MAG: hypothetical protein IKI11_03020 [Neisseriaceae bacterium]|nr:hypothetical protein [Neisseriaceae bacterium]